MNKKTEIGGESPTNGAEEVIEFQNPYVVSLEIEGTADLLLHRWNNEEVDAKSKAAKGSKAKKTDNVESYVYRNDIGEICLPGEYLRQSIIHAAKYVQDPRSPRKSAMDIFKAGVLSLTTLSSLGKKEWDYEDRRRVVIQRSGITRSRPAFKSGWKAEFEIMVTIPEYIGSQMLHQVTASAGRLVGVGDFRPTYGRFIITKWEVK